MEKDTPNFSETSSVGSDESLEATAGPNFAEFAKQMRYKKNVFFPHEYLRDGDNSVDFPTTFTKKEEVPKTTDLTTLFLIDSTNRDKSAFPQPTQFTLRLPRVYKNVKSIQIADMKLLCSFYYFSAAKSNIYLPIVERGRIITTYNNFPITKLITIRQGTYTINDLLNEIQTELNYTPLFYDFKNGFSDFVNIFSVSGDFSINFNQPGDTYYDSLNSKYITNPTMATIVSYYWGSRYADSSTFTLDQLKVAYYYPVLYEVLLDKNDKAVFPFLNIQGPIGSDQLPPDSHVIYNMAGINDPIALLLINNNLALLDTYRLNHTFRYSLVNKYSLAYDTNTLSVNFTTITLNTSLVNLINNTASSSLASIYTNLGLTTASYSNIQYNLNIGNVIYASMYSFLQNKLATIGGIAYGTYAASFFANYSNVMYFQNGTNAANVPSQFSLEFLSTSANTSSQSPYSPSNSPGYWPNIKAAKGYVTTAFSTINAAKSLIPYNGAAKNFLFGSSAIDPVSSFINVNRNSRSLDVLVNISSSQYTILKFKSPVRQTMQVETLPLPYYYRYSDYNKQGLYKGVLDLNLSNVPQKYFDISYSYFNYSNIDITNYSSIVLKPTFGTGFNDSFALSKSIIVNTLKSYYYFEFIAPTPPGGSNPCVNNTTLSLVSINTSNISTLFSGNFSLFVYHDRGAFMADLGFPRAENPLHYIASSRVSSSNSDATINISTITGDKYYAIFRSDTTTCPLNYVSPVVYYNDSNYTQITKSYSNFNPLGNPFDLSNLSTYAYVTNYNPDFSRLPVTSTLKQLSPDNALFNTSIAIKGPSIGYDISGVSNDLTDYIGFNTLLNSVDTSAAFRYDPLTSYTFQSVSPFNAITNSYFGTNSLNAILEPVTNGTYTLKGTSSSELKIVHWYEGYSIPQQLDDAFTVLENIGINQTSSMSQVLTSFPKNKNGEITFGRGINALGFVPNDGVFNVKSFAFKSCIYPLSGTVASPNDPNLGIANIGVFTGLSLLNPAITMSSALTLLKFDTSAAYGPDAGSGRFTYGTWYNFIQDSNYSNTSVNGFTPASNDLLSYNSMYYMVPFDSNNNIMTFSLLSGSLVPLPLQQTISTGTAFVNNQTAVNTPGIQAQPQYVIPVTSNSPIFQTQSQYEKSIPITTPSIAYRNYTSLVNGTPGLYNFNTSFSNQLSSLNTLGLTTYFTEYNNKLFVVNATSNVCSNALTSFPTATYASTLSTAISLNSGTSNCIKYMISPTAPLQNYNVTGLTTTRNIYNFTQLAGNNINTTTRSFTVTSAMSNLNIWIWGAGGATNSSNMGGAGTYVKLSVNINTLLSTTTTDCPGGISTLYLVVGKGGNRDNVPIINPSGNLQYREQPRYGGGGTSLLDNSGLSNSILLQGGGFSGLFCGSNITTATPLLIASGGGASGTKSGAYGGPGGFGIITPALPITTYGISSAIFGGLFYNYLPLVSIFDCYSNPVVGGQGVQNAADNNLSTYWNPVLPAILNPSNYSPTPNTYGVSLNFASNISQISKIRCFGPASGNTLNLPTGFIVYNDRNKTQVLYSNVTILPSDFQILNNQQFYDIFLTNQRSNVTINSNAWLIAGTGASPESAIQYSFDLINWIPTANAFLQSVTSIIYASFFNMWVAIGDVYIITSSDGIHWTLVYDNSGNPPFTSLVFAVPGRNPPAILVSAGDGNIYYYSRFYSWVSVGQIFSVPITRLRFLNGRFWAIGGVYLKYSTDGISWLSITNFTMAPMIDISYGQNRYIIAQVSSVPPLTSALIYSQDAITWANSSSVNLTSFTPNSLVFGNNIYITVGKTTDGSSFIKYSINGLDWSNSTFPITADLQRNDISFSNNQFVCSGKPLAGAASNQVSVLTSTNGITWSYGLSGGFNSSQGANSAAYGPITVIPNLSTLYVEIQKSTFNSGFPQSQQAPQIYELRPYNTVAPITTNTSTLIDGNLTTVFYPPELNTVDVTQYPFTFTFSQTAPLLNYIHVYTPAISGAQFTSVTISLDATASTIIYSNSNPTYTVSGSNYLYKFLIIPPLQNISKLYFLFTKATTGSLQITDIKGLYDSNMVGVQKNIASIQDLDNRSANLISTIFDNSLETYWTPSTFLTGDSLKLNITFVAQANRINRIRIINGPYNPYSTNLITAIGIYSDSDSTATPLFYTTQFIFSKYLTYMMTELDIPDLLGYNKLFIKLFKNTTGIPIINEIQFFNIGTITDDDHGYSGDTITLMRRSQIPASTYNGGGGAPAAGGNAGNLGIAGSYLTGGSPANPAAGLIGGGGGGGGGYYGGGGGGIYSDGLGGAGGGGAGYMFEIRPIFTVVDYGIAVPGTTSDITNYVSPGIYEQEDLVLRKTINTPSLSYGQGGNYTIDSGQGAHGVIVITYDTSSTTQTTSTATAPPSFIDGSKLTVYESPIVENTDLRNLAFTAFSDPIQSTQYAGYNWVWYNAYLSLVGNSLTTSFQPSSQATSAPVSFPSLPNSVFSALSLKFSQVASYYSNGTPELATSITDAINLAFIDFQNNYFVNISYLSANYVEMTKIYCILDYLRKYMNLTNPHVNPMNPTLDRILGGLPGFGYWANPFLVNASYVGFDVSTGLIPTPALSTIAQNGDPVQAMYGLVLEQSLTTGAYQLVDVMAYKPSIQDSIKSGYNWLTVSQFTESYAVRSLTNSTYLDSNVIVQPYTFQNIIRARLPLFTYNVYTKPTSIDSITYDVPFQVLNDFQGQAINMYTFQNKDITDVNSINLSQIPFTSTTIQLNQTNITISGGNVILGAIVSEYSTTQLNVVTALTLDTISYRPIMQYSTGSNNFYNTFAPGSPITSSNIGKVVIDYLGNVFFTTNNGSSTLYENTNTTIITPSVFSTPDNAYASSKYILGLYNSGNLAPYRDFFVSKFTNIWHVPANADVTMFYGARLNSSYDLGTYISFANQVFYPAHKIILEKVTSSENPITNTTDIGTYPSFQHTEMFFYKNLSTLVNDINGKFAMENTSNFAYSDMFSGYNFNSYMYNINLQPSSTSSDSNSFNYLAIRGYSPTETFQSLVRFYLPSRYDYGYISLKDLSNELFTIGNSSNVNPDYLSSLQSLNTAFSTNNLYGAVGIPGFSGSNISTVGFGDFLKKFNNINTINSSNSAIVSTVIGLSNTGLANLITGDLSSTLPSYLASRNRVTDPIEYSIPFSSCVTPSNALSPQYGIGYNLGFALADTPYNTVQRATSFFKIFDDYIYLQMNEEFNMNKMTISKPENFAQTLESTAQSGIYNSKLMLNTFGSFATTFVQSPVVFNPTIGKLDKLSFTWYGINGNVIDNNDCEWSGSITIVEAVNTQS